MLSTHIYAYIVHFFCLTILPSAPNSTRASIAAQQMRLPSDAARLEAATDVALFFALWGEAANLRLVPEALCFLFHKMSGELRRADALGVEPVRSEGAFLKCVVQPVYKVLCAQHVCQKRWAGQS